MTASQPFSGFTGDGGETTPIPEAFFSELLPAIDHLGELKVTLYALWALARREAAFPYLARQEMEEDKLLLQGLRRPGLSPTEALDEALERAVARGTLLMAQLEFPQGPERFYFLNSPRGRAAVKAIQQGRWSPSGDPRRPVALQLHRPTIYNLYEQNIGPLTPMIAELLREAEANYPALWIEEAMRIAVENNARKWSYVEAILERWKVQGKDEQKDRGDSEKARRKYLKGWFDG